MTAVQKWRALACSENPAERQLALDLAPSMAAEIQEELLLWLLLNPSQKVREEILPLLGPEMQQKLDEMHSPAPLSLHKAAYTRLWDWTEDTALQKVIAMIALEEASERPKFGILYQILAYKQLAHCGLLEARNAIEHDLYHLTQRAKNEGLIS